MNMTQLIDDIVCFIATFEWPEMYPVGVFMEFCTNP